LTPYDPLFGAIYNLHRKGYSNGQIAEHLGIHVKTVRKYLVKFWTGELRP